MDDFWQIEIIERDVVPERRGEWERAGLPDRSRQSERSSRNGPEKDNVEKEGVVDHRETKRYVGERSADKTKQGVAKEKKKDSVG